LALSERPGKEGCTVIGSAVAVIPVLNEARNVRALVESVFATGRVNHILVVDDGSTDGTLDVLNSLMRRHPSLDVCVRWEERGLGTALLFGFEEALRRYDFDRLVTMDSDLSHDPAYIPEMLDMPGDLILGSRYAGGGCIENWPLTRRMISLIANGLARTLLGLPVRDVTTGFRVYSRRLVERVVAEAECGGYEFQVEGVWLAMHHDLTVRETPIRFVERRSGRSKLATGKEAGKFVWFVLRKFAERLA